MRAYRERESAWIRSGAGHGAAGARKGRLAAASRRSGGRSGSRPSASRPALLCAAVEIHRATGDITAAREVADGTVGDRRAVRLELLTAYWLTRRRGSVLLRPEMSARSSGTLRAAASAWRAAHTPYDVARTAVSLGLACAAMGDGMGAEVEFGTARAIFGELAPHPTWIGGALARGLTAEADRGRRESTELCRPGSSRRWPILRRAEPIGRSPATCRQSAHRLARLRRAHLRQARRRESDRRDRVRDEHHLV